jgi:hypothetical protein
MDWFASHRLPLSAPELVESSPSLTTDGAVVMGVRPRL